MYEVLRISIFREEVSLSRTHSALIYVSHATIRCSGYPKVEMLTLKTATVGRPFDEWPVKTLLRPRAITCQDLQIALASTIPAVMDADMAQYKGWATNFGSKSKA